MPTDKVDRKPKFSQILKKINYVSNLWWKELKDNNLAKRKIWPEIGKMPALSYQEKWDLRTHK